MLPLSFDNTVVHRQDITTIIIVVANNVLGRQMAFNFMDEKWDDLLDKFGDSPVILANLVRSVLIKFSSELELKNVREFLQKHANLGNTASVFKESIETINLNIRWMDKNFDSIAKWLDEYSY